MFIVYHRTIISNGKACDVGQRKVSDLNIVKSNTLWKYQVSQKLLL